MQTLYIDVYFLINFTVDLLAIYFALMLSKVNSSTGRLIVASMLGALVAVISVLISNCAATKLAFFFIGLAVVGYIAPKQASIRRRLRFIISFLIFSSLLGAAVTFIWDMFDRFVYIAPDADFGGGVNRRLLLFALIVLLSIGVFKMIISFFTDSIGSGKVTLELTFMENKTVLDALIDSGNLAVDPMDMRPVLILKRSAAEKILPDGVVDLRDPDILPREMRKRIRLIPISRDGKTHVLTGVRLDAVNVVANNSREEVSVTVAIDKEGGSFGGYEALMPSAALYDVRNY